MADEIYVTSSLRVQKGPLYYGPSQPSGMSVTQNGYGGPTPGVVNVSLVGTDISLAQLTTPGWVRLQNLSIQTDGDLYFVEYGVWDSNTGKLFVLGELMAGDPPVVFRLSRYLGQEHGTGVGTGSSGSGDTLRFKAAGEATDVLIEAFER